MQEQGTFGQDPIPHEVRAHEEAGILALANGLTDRILGLDEASIEKLVTGGSNTTFDIYQQYFFYGSTTPLRGLTVNYPHSEDSNVGTTFVGDRGEGKTDVTKLELIIDLHIDARTHQAMQQILTNPELWEESAPTHDSSHPETHYRFAQNGIKKSVVLPKNMPDDRPSDDSVSDIGEDSKAVQAEIESLAEYSLIGFTLKSIREEIEADLQEGSS